MDKDLPVVSPPLYFYALICFHNLWILVSKIRFYRVFKLPFESMTNERVHTRTLLNIIYKKVIFVYIWLIKEFQ